jgi:hypothetical protein
MSRWIRRVAAFVLVVLVAGLVTSCGDDEERLSKGEFVKEMNALCKDRDKAFAVLDETNFFDPKEGAKIWADLRPVANDFVDGVAELEPPEDAADLHARYEDSVEDIPALMDDIVEAAEEGELKPYNQGIATLIADQQGDIDMAEYGASDCYDEDEALPQSQEPAEGATEVEVTATEYEFDIPEGIAPGKVAFTLVNEGNEMHIFGYGRLKEGATFEQLKAEMAKGDEPELMTDEGLTGLAGPEGRSTVNGEVEAGTYVAYCFIPAPTGESHMNLGMLVPFDVG